MSRSRATNRPPRISRPISKAQCRIAPAQPRAISIERINFHVPGPLPNVRSIVRSGQKPGDAVLQSALPPNRLEPLAHREHLGSVPRHERGRANAPSSRATLTTIRRPDRQPWAGARRLSLCPVDAAPRLRHEAPHSLPRFPIFGQLHRSYNCRGRLVVVGARNRFGRRSLLHGRRSRHAPRHRLARGVSGSAAAFLGENGPALQSMALAAAALVLTSAGWWVCGRLLANTTDPDLRRQIEDNAIWPWQRPVVSASLDDLG